MSLQSTFGLTASSTATTSTRSLVAELRAKIDSLKSCLLEEIASVMERIESLHDAKQNASVVKVISQVKKALSFFELPANVRYTPPPFGTSDPVLLDYQEKVHHALWDIHARLHFLSLGLVKATSGETVETGVHLSEADALLRQFLSSQLPAAASIASSSTASTAPPVSLIDAAKAMRSQQAQPQTAQRATLSTVTGPQQAVVTRIAVPGVAVASDTASESFLPSPRTATSLARIANVRSDAPTTTLPHDDDVPVVSMMNMKATVNVCGRCYEHVVMRFLFAGERYGSITDQNHEHCACQTSVVCCVTSQSVSLLSHKSALSRYHREEAVRSALWSAQSHHNARNW
jgi:hypothetical protein